MIKQTWKAFDRVVEHIEKVEPGTDEFDRALDEMMSIVILQAEIYKRPDFSGRFDWFLKNPALIGVAGTVVTAILMRKTKND